VEVVEVDVDEIKTGTDELDYRRLVRLVWSRKWVVLACLVLAAGAAYGASKLQSPIYQAKASLLVQQKATEDLFDNGTGRIDSATQDRVVKTEIKVLESQPIEDVVTSQLGRKVPRVHGGQEPGTNILTVSASSTDIELARAAADAYAVAYIEFRRTQAVDDVLAASKRVGTKVQEQQKELDALDARIAGLKPGAELTALQARRLSIDGLRLTFKEKLDQLQVDSAQKTGGAQLVEQAALPERPISPKPLRNSGLGGLLGLLIGMGLVFLLDQLDDDLKSKEDVEAASGGLPVLGLIPDIEHWKGRSGALVSVATKEERLAAEAYRALRTSVLFLGLDRQMRSIQVTSPLQGEGKSTSAANLAVTLAQAGTRVIAMCCDLRRPRLHEFFGLSNERGFTSVLLGNDPLQAVVQQVPGIANLKVVASGPVPTNPSELLLSDRAANVITALQSQCDLLLIDCPPVLPVTDAVAMSQRVQGTIVVVAAGATGRRELRRTIEVLRQVNAPLLGTVVNGITRGDSGYGYGYGYGDGYGYEEGSAKAAAKSMDGTSSRGGRTRGRRAADPAS